jgi:hypothetical protein
VPIWPNDAVVVNPDGYRLGITKTTRGRMAARARVVIVQSGDSIEPKQPADVGTRRVHWTAKPLFQSRLNVPSEAMCLESSHELLVKCLIIPGYRGHGWNAGQANRQQDNGCNTA